MDDALSCLGWAISTCYFMLSQVWRSLVWNTWFLRMNTSLILLLHLLHLLYLLHLLRRLTCDGCCNFFRLCLRHLEVDSIYLYHWTFLLLNNNRIRIRGNWRNYLRSKVNRLVLDQLILNVHWYSHGAGIVDRADWALVTLTMRVFDSRISFAIWLATHQRALVEDSPLRPERTFDFFLLPTLRCLISPDSCVLTTDLGVFIQDYRVTLRVSRQRRWVDTVVNLSPISHQTQIVRNLYKFISFRLKRGLDPVMRRLSTVLLAFVRPSILAIMTLPLLLRCEFFYLVELMVLLRHD